MLSIAEEIRRATLGLGGKVVDHGRVDALAWAEIADALGRDSIWAMSYIVRGHARPPESLRSRARRSR